MDIPLTFHCNNNCVSCIIDSRLAEMKGQMMWSEIRKSIDRIPESCDTVGITGGEPTISPIFFRALRHIRDKKPWVMVFLVSNCRAFSYKSFAERFASLGLKSVRVGVALYSHDPSVHDSITRSTGSWGQTIKGLRNLLDLGISVELRIIVGKSNYMDLPETAGFIRDNLKGVERVVFINMKYTGNAFINRERIFVRYSDSVPCVSRAAEILEKSGVQTRLFHFPLCTLPEEHREKAKGVTKQKSELGFSSKCGRCRGREECPMIWKTYLVIAGEDEFNAL